MSSYQYNCQDDSILLPILKKKVFSVLHRYVPFGIPANFLTLASILIVWSCFVYFINVDSPKKIDIFFAIIGIITYVIFDHFDGLQAKLTSTGSPLGEILDHYSDVFNGSIIIYIFFRILQIELEWLFFLTIWFNLIAFSITYYEQCLSNKLYFGKIGSLEGIVLVLIILCSSMTTQGKTFWTQYLVLDYPVYFFLVLVLILGEFYTTFSCLKRLKFFPKTFLHFFLMGSLLCYFCINNQISWYLSFLVINSYSAEFILKSMKSHLLRSDPPKPDILIYIFLFFLFSDTFFGLAQEIIFLCYGIALTLKIIWDLKKVFSEFSHYWVWWNHP